MAKRAVRPAQQQSRSEPSVPAATNPTASASVQPEGGNGKLRTKIATAAAVGVAAALIEVEWIPTVLLGAAAFMAPDVLPKVRQGFRPFIKGAIRAGYSVIGRTRGALAESREKLQDIIVEVRAENASSEPVMEPDAHGGRRPAAEHV